MNISLKQFFGGLLAVPLLAIGVVAVSGVPAYAGNCNDNNVNITKGVDCARGDQTRAQLFGGSNSLFETITNVLLFLIGAVSVIMLVVGGFRYVLSNGDSTQVANAKNTILYAVIGIIVALLAYAIVRFIVNSFVAGGGN